MNPPKVAPKKSSNVLIPVVIGALAVLAVVGGWFIVRGAYKAPLAPLMNPAAATDSSIVPAVDLGASSTAAPVTSVCGQTGSMVILFAGSDDTGGIPPSGADSVRLVKVDYDAQVIKVIAFPHDLVVSTASLQDPATPQLPLRLVFMMADQAATGTKVEKDVQAAQRLAAVLLDDFGVTADHFVAVEMDSIAAMVDTIGGVEVTVDAQVTTERNVTFPAGTQVLNGAQATEYIRFLSPGGEVGRTERQNEFIFAALAKVISPSILPQVPALLAQFKDGITTDLSPEQLVSMACLAGQIPQANMGFYAVGTSDLVTNDIPKVDAIRSFLATTLGN